MAASAIGLIVYSLVLGVLRKEPMLWIKSPQGNELIELPLWQATRIVRKHDWNFVDTVPASFMQPISRREALRILFRGDRKDV